MELERVIKLLNLTRSESSHECLSAIRKLNSSISSWDTFFSDLSLKEKLKEEYLAKSKNVQGSTSFSSDVPLWVMLGDIATYGSKEEKIYASEVLQINTQRGSIPLGVAKRVKEIYEALGNDR